MKLDDIEIKKQQLAEKKTKIEMKEKLLKHAERKLETKRWIEIGGIAAKAGIDHLDSPLLLGAFLDLKDRSQNEADKNGWTERAKAFGNSAKTADDQRLIISFSYPLPGDAKALLKRLRFRWIEFRNEWHGEGRLNEIEKAIEGMNGKIEVAPN